MPDDPRRNIQTLTIKANKSSAMRWAIGAAVLFVLGMVTWWRSDPRGEPAGISPQDLQEQTQPQPGYESLEGKQTPNPEPASPEPNSSGTQ